MPVWAAQAGTRLGGRFSKPLAEGDSIPVDPHVDETRNDIVQDLANSQNLKQIGYVRATSHTHPNEATTLTTEKNVYISDGLRAVMVFSEGPISLDEIEFLNWEKLVAPSNSNVQRLCQISDAYSLSWEEPYLNPIGKSKQRYLNGDKCHDMLYISNYSN